MSPPGWRAASALTSGEQDRFGVIAAILAAEFPRYEFATCQLHRGTAIAAVWDGPPSESGVYAVITDDMAEMRAALAEDGPSG